MVLLSIKKFDAINLPLIISLLDLRDDIFAELQKKSQKQKRKQRRHPSLRDVRT